MQMQQMQRNEIRLPQDPSPEEIRRSCRQIQEEWSRSDRRRRRAITHQKWSVPVVKTSALQQ